MANISHGFSEWITNGILRVSDIVNTDCSFCSKNSLQTKHGLTVSDMQYNQIINVLNSKLKSLPKNVLDSLVLISLPEQCCTDIRKITSKKVLTIFTHSHYKAPACQDK